LQFTCQNIWNVGTIRNNILYIGGCKTKSGTVTVRVVWFSRLFKTFGWQQNSFTRVQNCGVIATAIALTCCNYYGSCADEPLMHILLLRIIITVVHMIILLFYHNSRDFAVFHVINIVMAHYARERVRPKPIIMFSYTNNKQIVHNALRGDCHQN